MSYPPPCVHLQMGDLYASVIGTTVLQLKEFPLLPNEYEGAVCLFDPVLDEAGVRAALREFGTVVRYEVRDWPPVVVHFTTHEAALRTKQAATRLTHIAGGFDTLFNDRAYDDRGW